MPRLIHCAIEIDPQAPDFDIGLVEAPAQPNGTLAAVELFLQLRTVLHDPTVNGRVIHVDPTLFHEFFDMAHAQLGYAKSHRTPMRMTSGEKCAPLKLIAIVSLPHE